MDRSFNTKQIAEDYGVTHGVVLKVVKDTGLYGDHDAVCTLLEEIILEHDVFDLHDLNKLYKAHS